MLASQANRLHARGQATAAGLTPAGTVIIAGQVYTDFATGGLQRDSQSREGGPVPIRRVSFFAPVASFAPDKLPKPRQPVQWSGYSFAVDVVTYNASGTSAVITCISPDQ